MSKGTLLRILCLCVLNPAMLPSLPTTDDKYCNTLHGRGPWFAYRTPAEIATSSQKGCSKRQKQESHDASDFSSGLQQSPTSGTEGKELVAKGCGIRRGWDLRVPPEDKEPCPPQEGAEMQSKLPAPFLSLGGIWKCKALNTNCLNWTYVNLF